MAELARFRVGEVVRLVYRLGRPHSDMAICAASGHCVSGGNGKRGSGRAHTAASRRKPRAVWGDMAAVNLEVLLFACRIRPKRQYPGNCTRVRDRVCSPLWLSQAGLISCIIGVLLRLWAVMDLHGQTQRRRRDVAGLKSRLRRAWIATLESAQVPSCACPQLWEGTAAPSCQH